jgi:hypothetical protein
MPKCATIVNPGLTIRGWIMLERHELDAFLTLAEELHSPTPPVRSC